MPCSQQVKEIFALYFIEEKDGNYISCNMASYFYCHRSDTWHDRGSCCLSLFIKKSEKKKNAFDFPYAYSWNSKLRRQ